MMIYVKQNYIKENITMQIEEKCIYIYIFKYIKIVILNCNNISQYFCFCCNWDLNLVEFILNNAIIKVNVKLYLIDIILSTNILKRFYNYNFNYFFNTKI